MGISGRSISVGIAGAGEDFVGTVAVTLGNGSDFHLLAWKLSGASTVPKGLSIGAEDSVDGQRSSCLLFLLQPKPIYYPTPTLGLCIGHRRELFPRGCSLLLCSFLDSSPSSGRSSPIAWGCWSLVPGNPWLCHHFLVKTVNGCSLVSSLHSMNLEKGHTRRGRRQVMFSGARQKPLQGGRLISPLYMWENSGQQM